MLYSTRFPILAHLQYVAVLSPDFSEFSSRPSNSFQAVSFVTQEGCCNQHVRIRSRFCLQTSLLWRDKRSCASGQNSLCSLLISTIIWSYAFSVLFSLSSTAARSKRGDDPLVKSKSHPLLTHQTNLRTSWTERLA
jgi:hypothetical protein